MAIYLSIEQLNSIVDGLETIFEDVYPELLLEILRLTNSDLSAIEYLFIDCLQQRWKFNFKPAQMGLTKTINFVKLRGYSNYI